MAKKKSNTIKVLSDKQLSNKYASSGRASIIIPPDESILKLPSRFIALNYQMNGGIPYGKILELFGEESTGKSLLAMDYGYVCQALDGEVIWADAENSFNGSWFKKNGLDLERIHLMTEQPAMEVISDWIQDTVVSVRSRLKKNEPILLVLDSLAAIRCLGEIGEYMLDSSAKFGNRAKAISDFLGNRNTLFAKMGVCVILINQLRRKIGASQFEDPDKTVGGDAVKFYAAQRLGLVRGKQIKRKIKGSEQKVGQNIYTRTKKDKTGPPRNTTAGEVYFTGTKSQPVGFNKYSALPELLIQLEVVQRKKGSSRYYLDDKMIANGEENFIELLKTDEDLRKTLIKRSRINTISKTKQQLEKIPNNLYPVLTKKSNDDSQEPSGL